MQGKVDANGLPITYGVYLEDATSGNVCVKQASRECDVYNCEIKIVMSEDCLMEKESLFSIKVFAETLIGQSLSSPHLDLIGELHAVYRQILYASNLSMLTIILYLTSLIL